MLTKSSCASSKTSSSNMAGPAEKLYLRAIFRSSRFFSSSSLSPPTIKSDTIVHRGLPQKRKSCSALLGRSDGIRRKVRVPRRVHACNKRRRRHHHRRHRSRLFCAEESRSLRYEGAIQRGIAAFGKVFSERPFGMGSSKTYLLFRVLNKP